MPEQLLTAADLATLPGDARHELHWGRLVTLPPLDDAHAAAVSHFTAALFTHGQRTGQGRARCLVGVILARAPDHVLGPDALFITCASLPVVRSPEDYLETIPALVVEVRARAEPAWTIPARARDFLRAGVRLVGGADPTLRVATEYRVNVPPRVHREDDTLTAEDTIPGFALSVRTALQD